MKLKIVVNDKICVIGTLVPLNNAFIKWAYSNFDIVWLET